LEVGGTQGIVEGRVKPAIGLRCFGCAWRERAVDPKSDPKREDNVTMANRGVTADVRRRALRAGAMLAAGVAAVSIPAIASASDGCSNEPLRTGPSAALPDCRAYELVSPLRSEPEPGGHAIPVSLTGDRVGFFTEFGPAPGLTGASAGPYYLSTRGPAGWSTANEIPPQSTGSGLFCSAYVAGYSADLSQAVLGDGWNWTGYPRYPDDNSTHDCGHDEPLLAPGEPLGAQNIFLHSSDAPNEAGFYQLLNSTPPGVAARDAYFQAGSADFSHIVFTSPLQLTPEAPLPPQQTTTNTVGEDLYENVGGALRLLTVLPGGAPTWGILANGWESDRSTTSASFTHAVSEDGERVFFYGDGEQYCERPMIGTSCPHARGAYLNAKLYLRQNAAQRPAAAGECAPSEAGRACTVQIDEPNSDAPPGPGGGGQFQSGSPDGARAFFTDCARLTADSTAVSASGCGGFALTEESGYQQPTGNDLYEYDVEKPVGQRLVDLTVDANGSDSFGADVQGVAGISKDGSYVYFVATGVLTGSEENEHHEQAAVGETNLYLRHAGATTFIATLGPPMSDESAHAGRKNQIEACDWSSFNSPEWEPPFRPGVPTGPCLTSRVSSDGRFLAFNSHHRLTGYDNTVAATGEPSFEIFLYDAETKQLHCASCEPEGNPPTAAQTFEQPSISTPLLTGEGWLFTPLIPSDQLADHGQVFFETTNSLLPADVNGANSDVYEYEDGQLHLISAGIGDDPSYLRNASPDGSNVFFTTADALVGTDSDSDNATSLYDARVGGGFPEPSAPAAPCDESAIACRGATSAPPGPSLASATFTGPGNLPNAPAVSKPSPKPLRCRNNFKKVRVHGHSVCRRVRRHHRHAHAKTRRGARR
jgi:hypothetical protein